MMRFFIGFDKPFPTISRFLISRWLDLVSNSQTCNFLTRLVQEIFDEKEGTVRTPDACGK